MFPLKTVLSAYLLALSAGAAEPAGVPMDLELPKPCKQGTPLPLKYYTSRVKNLELGSTNAPPRLLLPEGAAVISRGKPVTSSDPYPIVGDLALVTDGDKEGLDGSFVELGPDTQWVQVDLGAERRVDAVVLWQHHAEPYRVYHDNIVQVSNDPDFVEGVATILNTDDDNSSGLGVGRDPSWFGRHWGRPVAGNGARGRYVRCHSRGNTSNEMNHYIEVEVWGRP